MLRRTNYVAIWVFVLLGIYNMSSGFYKNNMDQFEYGLVWLGIASIAGLVYWFSKKS